MRWIWVMLLAGAGWACEEDGDAGGTPIDFADAEILEGADDPLDQPDAPDAEAEADGAPDAGADAAEPDAAPAQDTWDSWAQGFFAAYCTECHSGGTRDYRTIAEVIRDQDKIRCGVGPEVGEGCGAWPPPRQFPVGNGPKPGDDERARLVAWVEDGLAE